MKITMKRIICIVLSIVLFGSISCSTAFADSITLPVQILSVGEEAFYGDTSITEVVIPNGTEMIGKNAFANSGLECIHIPDSVTTIENDAFLGCDGLTIWCSAGSYTRGYADEHGITWVDISAYSEIIEKYREAYESDNANNGYHNESYAYQHGISPYIGYSEHVGYTIMDLDDNGIPELVVAGIDPKVSEIFSLFTLSGDELIHLATSRFRYRFCLRTDNTLINCGSGGAAYASNIVKQVNNTRLKPTEAIFTYYDFDSGHFGYYYQASCNTYDPGEEMTYVPNEESIEIDEETYYSMRDKYESTIYVPPLTLIA